MFLFHFPSSYLAWVLPSALPGGARTFLPDESGRSPDLLDYLALYPEVTLRPFPHATLFFG